MAVQSLRLRIVFTIGFCLGPVALGTVPSNVTDKPIPLSLNLDNPEDVVVAKGQPAAFHCRAHSNSTRLRHRWYFNDTLIVPDDARRRQLDNGTLYIPKVVGRRSEGSYHCLVSNENGSLLSNSATLRIAMMGREFLQQPISTIVQQHQPTLLKCQIHSIPAANVQWERNNLPLPQSTRYLYTSEALIITRSDLTDSGAYRCTASNRITNKTKYSDPAELTVIPNNNTQRPPEILDIDSNTNITALVGEKITLHCIASGWPKPAVWWLNNRNVVISNETTLVLKEITAEMAGFYNCTAVNEVGHVTKSYYLNVHQKPYFITKPLSKLYPPAKTLRLDCQVNGIPPPQVYWLINGSVLHMQGRIKKQPTGLVLSHSFTRDAGIYQCVAVNSVGKVWAPVQLAPTVTDAPNPPQNFRCRPFDDSSICLEWTAPSNISVQAYSVYSIYAGLGPEFVTTENYQLATGLRENTNYTFYTRLYSTVASDGSEQVFCKTGAVGSRDLRINAISNSAILLKWSSISSDTPCGGVMAPFKVQWKRTNQMSSNVKYIHGFNTSITGLQPSVEYEFRVQSCSNKNDKSMWTLFSFPANVSQENISDESVGSAKPLEHFDVNFLNRTAVNLTWPDYPGNSIYYVVCYTEVNKGCGTNSCSEELRSTLTYIVLNNLKSNTWYEFKVQGYNSMEKPSSLSHALQVQTESDLVIPPIEDLKVELLGGRKACVTWRPPKSATGIFGYIVYYTANRDGPLEDWNYVKLNSSSAMKMCNDEGSGSLSVELKNLKMGREYKVVVRAVTDAGFGELSKPLVVKTDGDRMNVKYKESINQKQKLGVILGLVLAIICIIACISCLLLRRRCLKRRALARARMVTSNNYYRPPVTSAHETSLGVQLESSCSAEAHEMQQLMTEECPRHIPQTTTTHLDTKGGAGYPNGQLNGAVKCFQNGSVANGNIHIRENPQFCDHDEMPSQGAKGDTCGLLSAFKTTTLKQDTNSNLQRSPQKGNNACSMCAQSTAKHCNGQLGAGKNHCSEIRDVNSINKGGMTYNTQLTV